MEADEARRVGLENYRRVFQGTADAGSYVLTDLRRYCRAGPEETDLQAMLEEELTDRDQYLMHCAQVMVYRYITRLLSVTDADLDRYHEELRQRFEGAA